MSNIDAYLWGYKNWKAADVSFRKFREFYPSGQIFIKVDKGGEFMEYHDLAIKFGAYCSENPFRLGYPGNHGDHQVGRDCWPKDNTLLWLDNIYWTCKMSSAKHIIVLEEDTFILKPISILNQDFGIAVFEYNTNTIPDNLLHMIELIGGNTDIPLGKWGKGYGAGGGFIINREQWINSYDFFRGVLELNYDNLVKMSKLIGWSDCVAQLVIMAGGHKVVMNPQLVQAWYHERPDLYPTYTDWRDYEIVDYIKDYTLIP